MAKATPKPRAKPKPAAAVAPPPPPPPSEPVEVPPAAEERESRRATIVAIAIAVVCACFTGLLLSGWTPGPHQSAPPRIAAKIAPAPPKKKTVKPTPKPKAKTPAPKPKPAKRITPRQFAAELFVGECGFCHTLSAVGTKGTAGPNLDQLRPTETRVLNAIAAGGRRTGLMPPGILTGADAKRVATFVAEATRR
jgi:mono/diheme cytochrome c family protein